MRHEIIQSVAIDIFDVRLGTWTTNHVAVELKQDDNVFTLILCNSARGLPIGGALDALRTMVQGCMTVGVITEASITSEHGVRVQLRSGLSFEGVAEKVKPYALGAADLIRKPAVMS